MTGPQDARLLEFQRRVEEWSDRKRLKGKSADAIEAFEELNAQSNGLVSPWPELAAYRLAMLLLRRGEGADLERIDVLLTRASRCIQLGPRPLLYLLGVLHRRRLSSKVAEAEVLEQRVDRAFEEARSRTDHRGSRDGEPVRRLQDEVFNMLELAAVFLGREMDDLDGRDGPFGGLGLSQRPGWQILGNSNSRCIIRYPYELAVCEIEAQRERDRSLILVREPAGGAFEYWLPDGDGWCNSRSSPPWIVLRWTLQATPVDATDAANRQTLKRARDWFVEHLGHPWTEGSFSEGLSLGPSPPVMIVTQVSRRGS